MITIAAPAVKFIARSRRRGKNNFHAEFFVVLILAALPGHAADGQGAGWQAAYARARQNLQANDLGLARQDFHSALQIAESANQIEPGVVNCLTGLSLLAHKEGQIAESERLYELAMRNLEALYGPSDPRFADWLPDLAWLYDQHGKSDKSEVLLKRLLNIREQHFGESDPRVVQAEEIYAQFLRQHDRGAEANMLELKAQSSRAKKQNY